MSTDPRSPPPPAAATPVIALEGVGVELGGLRVLDDVSLGIRGGGVTALTGPSGSGKSTLLRLLNRLISPARGVVRLRGEDMASLGSLAVRRRVALVMQHPVPFPGTVRDNLLVARPGADDDRMGAVLERAALPAAFLGRIADDLSGGEAQRMCIARALMTDPEVVLADEPTASLDEDAARQVEELLVACAARGSTVVVVSHDPAQVRRIAGHVIRLEAGRVVAAGAA